MTTAQAERRRRRARASGFSYAREQVMVGLASIPEREKPLRQVVEALAPQVGRINLALNGYDRIPGWLENHENVVPVLRPDGVNKGDGEKFAAIDDWDGYVLTCDDDLLYPPDYVANMVAGVERYGRKRAVSHHAGYVTGWTGHAATATQKRVRCLRGNGEDKLDVNLIGTGVTAWHTDGVPIWSGVFRHANMADVQLACHLRVMGVECVALAHREGWLKDICPPENQGRRIYTSNRNRDGSACDTHAQREQEITRYWQFDPARPKVRVSISTCQRPDTLRELLDDLTEQTQWADLEVTVYEDPTNSDYGLCKRMCRRRGWQWVRMDSRKGRERYWQITNRQFRDAKRSRADWFLFLQDDVRLVRYAIPKAIATWCRLDDPATLTLWRLRSLEERPNWTGKTPVQRDGATEIFHADGIYLCKRDTLAYMGFQMGQPKNMPPTGSGVGLTMSRRLDALGARMYRVDSSLVTSNDGGVSIMNPDERRLNPAVCL